MIRLTQCTFNNFKSRVNVQIAQTSSFLRAHECRQEVNCRNYAAGNNNNKKVREVNKFVLQAPKVCTKESSCTIPKEPCPEPKPVCPPPPSQPFEIECEPKIDCRTNECESVCKVPTLL